MSSFIQRFSSLKKAVQLPSITSTDDIIRSFTSGSKPAQKFSLPDLPYDYSALEPVLPARIMELHHSKHHATYVNNLNASLEKREDALAKGDIAAVVGIDAAIKFNGGGHVNHSIFWTNLAPIKEGGGGEPSNELADEINSIWGSFEKFKETFNGTTVGVQGSGWGWLVYSPNDKTLKIQTMKDQDPVGSLNVIPLLGIDVWEHAYYLKYENRRADYLKEIWKIINWDNVSERYQNAKQKK